MPGDLNSSIGYLDVQFGAMDIMLDGNSFDSDTKFGSTNSTTLDSTTAPPSSNMDLNASTQQNLDAYSSAKSNTQSSISSAISQGVSIKFSTCLCDNIISGQSYIIFFFGLFDCTFI